MDAEPITPQTVRGGGDAKPFNEALYLALARHRRTQGEKQYEVAARIGVSPAELSRWIYGGACPSAEKAAALADVVGEPFALLFPREHATITGNTPEFLGVDGQEGRQDGS
jgi:transcriptional regulator with XRE-family HTH domain